MGLLKRFNKLCRYKLIAHWSIKLTIYAPFYKEQKFSFSLVENRWKLAADRVQVVGPKK